MPRVRALRVFAAEPTSLQLDWAALGPGPVRIRAADAIVDLVADGGPGAVTIDGLPEGHRILVVLTGEAVPGGRLELSAVTPVAPPGAELARIATISDAHVGETTFGYLHTIGESAALPLADTHPLRCVRAAIDDLRTWGAQQLVVKGDLVDQSHPGYWQAAIDVLEGAGLPVHIIPGNHETKTRRTIEPAEVLSDTPLTFTTDVERIDLGGSSLVLVNTAVAGEERGHLHDVHDALIDALDCTSGGALVAMHHHLRRNHAPSGWPVGVPVSEAQVVLDDVARVHPNTLITSGHVHRNRLWRRGPLTMTSIGSVKDYPGVWAGYVFHEGGMRQAVKRVEAPSAIQWTERTGDALGGFYRHWTPSSLAARCVTLTW